MFRFFRNHISGATHALGAFLSVAGLTMLLYRASGTGNPWMMTSFAVFGISLILLYTASALYHLLPLGERWRLFFRKLDHMMIYVLITGTYTPMCLVALRGPWGWGLLGTVMALLIGGIVMKSVWMDAPRWLSTSIYVLMGWLVAVALLPLSRAMPLAGMVWLAVGGLMYTVGAVIYGLKWPSITPRFGFHEIWHLFVMAGSLSHFWMVFRYIAPLG